MRNKLFVLTLLILTGLISKIILYKRPLISKTTVWIHRGGSPENSLIGISNTIKNGKTKIELDVRQRKNTFIISHDKPEENQKIITLKEVLNHRRLSHIWIDYKEYSLLNNLLTKEQIKVFQNKKLIIETKSILTFLYFKMYNIKTFYWYNPERYFFSKFGFNFLLLNFFKIINHSTLSMDSKYIKQYISEDFNYNTFTINDSKHIKELCEKNNINIILTDKNTLGCQ